LNLGRGKLSALQLQGIADAAAAIHRGAGRRGGGLVACGAGKRRRVTYAALHDRATFDGNGAARVYFARLNTALMLCPKVVDGLA
jgi:hypothetical protein